MKAQIQIESKFSKRFAINSFLITFIVGLVLSSILYFKVLEILTRR